MSPKKIFSSIILPLTYMSIVSPRISQQKWRFFSHSSQVPGGQIRSGPKFDLLYAPQAGNDQEHHVQATALGLPQKSNTQGLLCHWSRMFPQNGPKGYIPPNWPSAQGTNMFQNLNFCMCNPLKWARRRGVQSVHGIHMEYHEITPFKCGYWAHADLKLVGLPLCGCRETLLMGNVLIIQNTYLTRWRALAFLSLIFKLWEKPCKGKNKY